MPSALDEIVERLRAMDPAAVKAISDEVMETSKHNVWVPNPGPQTDAHFSQADELFYGGQAGGGKTDLIIGLATTEHDRSLLLRRTNTEAEKLPDRMIEILGTTAGLRRAPSITWKLGSRVIDIGGCQHEEDKQKRKGIPHDLKAFDEITDFTESQYRFIIAWNRSAKPDQRCRVVCTGNPPTTAEGYWVIAYWAPWLDPTHPNPAAPGELRWFTTDPELGKDIEVDGPGPHIINGEEVYARSRTFIPAKLGDNPDLARTNYDAVLASLPERERLAYRDGRFDASMRDQAGQTIPTEWIKLAQARWSPRPPDAIPMCAIGVDCTGGGKDPMIIQPRYDLWFAEPIVIPGARFDIEDMSRQAAGEILAVRRDQCPVVIDMGGGYGSGTYEHMTDNGVECVAYKGSEGTTLRARESKLGFRNVRTGAIWKMREALDPSQPGGSSVALPPDPEIIADLTAPVYEVRNGTISVEPKEHVVARLGRSTDKGDAIVMSNWYGARMETHALEFIRNEQRHSTRGRMPRVVTGRKLRTGRK